jgi:microcystin-dependent protein
LPDPYLGEIRMFGGNFAPLGWHFCDGTLLPISQYDALYALLGTTFGGDGQTTFALPDLRGRVPLHQGSGYVMGQLAGSESVTLTTLQIPSHTHTVSATGSSAASTPSNEFYGQNTLNMYAAAPSGAMATAAVSYSGGGQPHSNMMPFQAINYIIALEGIFPTQG